MRIAARLLLGLLAFQSGTCLVREAVGEDPRGELGAARLRYAEAADRVELVVIGSSRVEAGVDADELARGLRAGGAELEVLNLGVSGLRGLEQTHVLREVLANRGPRLRWVVLEAWPPGITVRRNTDYSSSAMALNARSIGWHTTPVTRRALAAIAGFDLPLVERGELARHHLGLWARRTWNLGLLSERLLEPPGAGIPKRAPKLAPADDAARPSKGRKWKSAWTLEQYARRASQVTETNRLEVDLGRLDLEVYGERERLARAAGVELIYLTMPGETGSPELLRMADAGLFASGRPALLHFNDPEQYGELFEPGLRKTPAHLNAEGAEVFSRLLAEHLLRLGVGN